MLTVIIAVVVAILQIILFFKLWGMCNNVKKLTKQIEDNATISIDDLLHMWHTKSPDFEKKLEERIYRDLKELFATVYYPQQLPGAYQIRREVWQQRCEAFGWEFPESLRDLPTVEDFSAKYRFSSMIGIR